MNRFNLFFELFFSMNEGHGVTDMVMWYWMWWKRNSRTMLERWRIWETQQERSIAAATATATQCDGLHSTTTTKTVIQISLLIRTQQVMGTSWGLNQLFSKTRTLFGLQDMALCCLRRKLFYFSFKICSCNNFGYTYNIKQAEHEVKRFV